MSFKPLLAPGQDPLSYPEYFDELEYPYLVSPKLDGIRAIVKENTVYSRTGKPLPSFQVQDDFGICEHLDGELIVGDPTATNAYNLTQSHVMAHEKFAEVFFHVFDYTHPDVLHLPFYQRFEILEQKVQELAHPFITVVSHHYVESHFQLESLEYELLEEGYEGVMLRNPVGIYKNGRATWNQNIIRKLKRFQEAEAIIISFKEQMTNTNAQEKDELGYSKRSYKLEGMLPAGTLGAFIVDYAGDILEIAPGAFSHTERKKIWNNQFDYAGRYLKFRYFNYGVKDKPRFPRAVGFRDRIDL
jgi:DNA ligase-1